MSDQPINPFLRAPVGVLSARTAPPFLFVMGMSGLFAVVDALLPRHSAGPEALAAGGSGRPSLRWGLCHQGRVA